jgi:hypothetical protein
MCFQPNICIWTRSGLDEIMVYVPFYDYLTPSIKGGNEYCEWSIQAMAPVSNRIEFARR